MKQPATIQIKRVKKIKKVVAQPQHVLVEGPEPSQDLSYKFLMKFPEVKLLEEGISLDDFERQALVRDINTEFRLLRRLTETEEHLQNQERCG